MKRIKFSWRQVGPCLLPLLLSGCATTWSPQDRNREVNRVETTDGWATTEVWNKVEGLARCAQQPNLRLHRCQRPPDVLVQYNEATGGGRNKPRAYFLFAEQERVARGLKPRFLSKVPTTGLEPIPVIPVRHLDLAKPLDLDSYAMYPAGGPPFALVLDRQVTGRFPLPSYQPTGNKALCVALMPFAAALDIAVAATAALAGVEPGATSPLMSLPTLPDDRRDGSWVAWNRP